MSSKNLG